MTAFADLPVYCWRATKAGRVKAVLSAVEDMYLLYAEDGKYIGGIHEDCLDSLLEAITEAPSGEQQASTT